MTRAFKKNLGMIEDHAVMDSEEIQAALRRIADQILENHSDQQKLLLVGIRTGGVFLAERIRQLLIEKRGDEVQMGVMDITLYRDDPFFGLPRPEVGSTELPGTIEGRKLILVDDVLFTGRTVRSALVELMDYGRPQCIELAVLIDRGHRELPIQPNYFGAKIKTKREQSVLVFLKEQGQFDRVAVYHQKSTSVLAKEQWVEVKGQ